MKTFDPTLFDKIANPTLAVAALHDNTPHGEFKALVRLAQPGSCPSGIKVMEIHSSDLFEVRIPCGQIEHIVGDRNVLRIELCEFVSDSRFGD